MSGIATAIIGGAVIGGITSSKAAGKAAKASEKGSELAAAGQERSLEYLKEVEALPRAFREAALGELGAEYGLTMDEEGNVISGGPGVAERARTSPFYTTGVELGEEAVMRAAPMTGGLRSGNVSANLADVNQRLYVQSYMRELQGLEGMAGLPSYATDIAELETGIGATRGAGQIAAGQARQTGYQGVGDAATGGISNLLYAKGQGLI